ncbi:MAG: hypothetical protein J5I62_05735 [Flavobacteriales bacterium]|nr:hypothetical protein [Flavobacteriales bacterium]
MDTKDQDKSKLRPLGNESPDPFSPTLPPGSLHEILRQEEDDPSGEPTQAMDDPDAVDPKKEKHHRKDEGGD